MIVNLVLVEPRGFPAKRVEHIVMLFLFAARDATFAGFRQATGDLEEIPSAWIETLLQY